MSMFLQRLESRIARAVAGASDARVKRWTEPRWVADGHPLDRKTQLLLRVSGPVRRSMPSMTPDAARKYYARIKYSLEVEPPVIERSEDIVIPTRSGGRPGRVYEPSGASGPLPAFVYFHGGGHTIGDLDTHDTLCRRICAGAQCIVVAVDYRRAPEHPFPAAAEDADDAYRWVCASTGELGVRPDRIAVGGDSAGGNLSAVVSFLARDRDEALPCVQLLIYPGVGTPDHPGRKKPKSQRGFTLDVELLEWFRDQYVPDGNWESPVAAPLNLESFEGLPPAIVITTPFDPLCGEGIDYAERLSAAGVSVIHQHVTDLPHDFMTMSVLPRAREAIGDVLVELRKALWA